MRSFGHPFDEFAFIALHNNEAHYRPELFIAEGYFPMRCFTCAVSIGEFSSINENFNFDSQDLPVPMVATYLQCYLMRNEYRRTSNNRCWVVKINIAAL
jgi:hypothetical protein